VKVSKVCYFGERGVFIFLKMKKSFRQNKKPLIGERAKKIRAVVFDADGVFFTGRVFIDPEKGEVLKERSHVDGQGISLLRAVGIRIAFVSGGTPGFVERIGDKLNVLPSVKNGTWSPVEIFSGPQGKGKVESIDAWLRRLNLSWPECAYMGDDISDYQILRKVGFSGAPQQAEDIIKNIVHYVAPRRGGDGAIRDFANFILDAQGVDILTLSLR